MQYSQSSDLCYCVTVDSKHHASHPSTSVLAFFTAVLFSTGTAETESVGGVSALQTDPANTETELGRDVTRVLFFVSAGLVFWAGLVSVVANITLHLVAAPCRYKYRRKENRTTHRTPNKPEPEQPFAQGRSFYTTTSQSRDVLCSPTCLSPHGHKTGNSDAYHVLSPLFQFVS